MADTNRHGTDEQILKALQINTQVLIRYLEWQLRKASETPAIAEPTTFNLKAPPSVALQVVPANARRHEIGIVNYGADDIIFGTQWFDPTSILQQFNDPSHPDAVVPGPNQAVHIGYLPSGNNITIKATKGVWAYNLGGTGALLSFFDEVYIGATDVLPDNQTQAWHLSGLLPSEQSGGALL